MKTTPQIFLSYAREDEEAVKNLYQRLSAAGFKPWMDRDLLPGEKWEARIRKAIRDSDFFLACLSANSINRRGVLQKEINEALAIWQEKLEDDIYLIPVRLDACQVPERLRDFQWTNLFEEEGWTKLVKAIQVGRERRGETVEPVDEEVQNFGSSRLVKANQVGIERRRAMNQLSIPSITEKDWIQARDALEEHRKHQVVPTILSSQQPTAQQRLEFDKEKVLQKLREAADRLFEARATLRDVDQPLSKLPRVSYQARSGEHYLSFDGKPKKVDLYSMHSLFDNISTYCRTIERLKADVLIWRQQGIEPLSKPEELASIRGNIRESENKLHRQASELCKLLRDEVCAVGTKE